MSKATDIKVKICGIRTPGALAAAAEGGAAFVGFVFHAASPRHLAVEEARALAGDAPAGLAKVGLFVDPDDAALDAVLSRVPLDILQLHGAESPARVAEIRARTGLPAIKALGVATADDLVRARDFAGVADMFLFDAKPAPGAAVPGGTGLAFDWELIAGFRTRTPWFLAGGLTPQNVAEAIDRTGARMVDVSSGVERSRGVKDPALIHAFLKAARGARAPAENVHGQ